MVEVGPRTRVLGPTAIVGLLVLAVAGVVTDGNRGDAGHPSLAAGVGPLAATAGCGSDANRSYRPVLGFA